VQFAYAWNILYLYLFYIIENNQMVVFLLYGTQPKKVVRNTQDYKKYIKKRMWVSAKQFNHNLTIKGHCNRNEMQLFVGSGGPCAYKYRSDENIHASFYGLT